MSEDIVHSKMRAVFRERSSKKTVSFEELIMSKDIYTSMFSHIMKDIVVNIVHIFFNAHEKIFTNILLFVA